MANSAKHTSMAMVSGMVDVAPIWRALGRDKATALPVFHAFTGADNVGRFSGVGKTKMLSTLHQGGKEHSQSTNETTWGRRSNAGGERHIGQLIGPAVYAYRTAQKVFRSQVSLTSDGICFANTWHKVTSCLQQLVPSRSKSNVCMFAVVY